jgi:hypothetical protein
VAVADAWAWAAVATAGIADSMPNAIFRVVLISGSLGGGVAAA